MRLLIAGKPSIIRSQHAEHADGFSLTEKKSRPGGRLEECPACGGKWPGMIDNAPEAEQFPQAFVRPNGLGLPKGSGLRRRAY